jgi:hypothetical protein
MVLSHKKKGRFLGFELTIFERGRPARGQLVRRH